MAMFNSKQTVTLPEGSHPIWKTQLASFGFRQEMLLGESKDTANNLVDHPTW